MLNLIFIFLSGAGLGWLISKLHTKSFDKAYQEKKKKSDLEYQEQKKEWFSLFNEEYRTVMINEIMNFKFAIEEEIATAQKEINDHAEEVYGEQGGESEEEGFFIDLLHDKPDDDGTLH